VAAWKGGRLARMRALRAPILGRTDNETTVITILGALALAKKQRVIEEILLGCGVNDGLHQPSERSELRIGLVAFLLTWCLSRHDALREPCHTGSQAHDGFLVVLDGFRPDRERQSRIEIRATTLIRFLG
jgi:hypothetical protein